MQVISFGSKISAAKQAATGLQKAAQEATQKANAAKLKGATLKKPLTNDVFNKAAKPAGHK